MRVQTLQVSDEQPEPVDEALIELFNGRDGELSEVVLRDGQRLRVLNIAWGYDLGDEYAHVTTNISPFVDGMPIEFFFTEDVVRVVEPRTGEVLYRADVAGGEQ
ncbi:hypothetical protein GCM10009554_25380 [Kribbella koreensis]|uniref:Uncharacterized protein n=1 Tax=Kribbella koreensis TaxID=57909 RepID=A0ABN1Q463_9ACTN